MEARRSGRAVVVANNEGIATAPESECTVGQKAFYWADDGATGGNSIRNGSIPCGRAVLTVYGQSGLVTPGEP